MNNTKQCSKCKEVKPVTEFSKDKSNKDGLHSYCKSCVSQYQKEWYKNNKETVHQNWKKWIARGDNKEKKAKYDKEYHKTHKEKVSAKAKQWRETNKEKIYQYKKKRREGNPVIKLREDTNTKFRRVLTGKQKNSLVFDYVPYTPKEFRDHFESLWEPWMNWDNYGRRSKDRRTWQMDHIVPQTHPSLIYDSFQHPGFQKCWALSNLRPLCSLENYKKRDKLLTEES